jgi:hypothetical protein
MPQTKSPAHTAACRKILDPSHCSCHVGAYLDQHPFICTQHTLSWHHKERITCEEFDAGLDEAVGFSALAEDEVAAESRRFKIGRDEEVQAQARRAQAANRALKAAKQEARYWRRNILVVGACFFATNVATVGHIIGWW